MRIALTPAAIVLILVGVAACGSDAPTRPLQPSLGARTIASGNVITVMNANDVGTGSLRQAVADATDGTTILFNEALGGQTIIMAGTLAVNHSVTIEGPPNGITLGGVPARRVSIPALVDVTLRNLTIRDGRAGGVGDNIANLGKLTLDHSTVTGGSGTVAIWSNGDLAITNSTVSGNHNAVQVETGVVTIVNSTITDNDLYGILASNGAQITLRNSIVAINSVPPAGANCFVSATPPLASISLDGTNMSDTDACGTGAGIIVTNPLLGPLANNGGPTMTRALLKGSLATDAATNCTVTTDQRYLARPKGQACDIGAYEFDSFISAPITVDASVAVNPTTGAAVVTGKITCPEALSVELQVTLSQQQKIKKVTAVSHASDVVVLNCSGAKTWSVVLAPSSGAFENGTGTLTAQISTAPTFLLRPVVTTAAKLFWGHK